LSTVIWQPISRADIPSKADAALSFRIAKPVFAGRQLIFPPGRPDRNRGELF